MAGGQFEQHGAQPQKQPKFVPLFIDKTFTGIYTQRNVLHDPSDFWTKNYGGRPDALWMGSNVELTNRLTLQRRPGLSPFSTTTYPSSPNTAFSFELINGNIQVIVDTGSTGELSVSSVATASGGSAVYTGIFPNGGSNAYVGMIFQIAGFTNANNNGVYYCIASTTTTLTLVNSFAVLESVATVVSRYTGSGLDTGGGNSNWSQPFDIEGPPDQVYTSSLLTTPANTSNYFSNNLDTTVYGFGLSGGDVVDGLQVTISGFSSLNPASVSAALINGGVVISDIKTALFTTDTAGAPIVFGSSIDKWNATLTSAVLNSTTFGVRFYISGLAGQPTPTVSQGFIDYSQISVYKTGVGDFSGSATSSGAVYVDNQNGTKSLLFGKSFGAGQTHFTAVAGILYMGDGIDTNKYTPNNTNGLIWKWGIAAPTVQPSVTIVPSGSAAVLWEADTVWSTMGLLYDSGTNTTQQLISVNASTTNTTRFGSTGSGQPAWNNTPGGTTSDNTITWTNAGPVVLWTSHTVYNSAKTGGTITNPAYVYDPVTKSIYECATDTGGQGTSGSSYPNFKPGNNQGTGDNGIVWIYIGGSGLPNTWQPNTGYPVFTPAQTILGGLFLIGGDQTVTTILEPIGLNSGFPTNQTVYLQTSNGGTSGAGGVSPKWNTLAGQTTGGDGDLIWLSLGSDQWAALTNYSAWSASGTIFSAIRDSNGNFQVCIKTGQSGSTQPTWSAGYGSITSDGTTQWTCVGVAMQWAASTQWYLPVSGFSPPSSSSPFGGASVQDSNSDIEFIVNSGLGGGSHPPWNSIGEYTSDAGTALTLTQVSVSGVTTTYTGTITGGAANALLGKVYLIAGFTIPGNNVLITVTASTATTLVCTTTSQANETHAGTATTGAIWFNLEAATANSLSWTRGYVYAYSFKARSLTDFYSVNDSGTNSLPIPPGLSNPLPTPTGSETGDISTASPVFIITGPDAGAVNTVSGFGSLDPQVDTIIIWRSADGGGASNMFELTEIPSPAPIGGVAQPWSFKDFLPDTPTDVFPGLNPLIPAPIDDSNDPPPPSFLPMVYNFQRIWGADGQNVLFSGGPDVPTGNPNGAFDPIDSLPFLANVVRLVKTSQGLVTFLTDSIELIAGGPATQSFYSVTLAPGTGLSSYNALDQFAGEIYFFSSDNRLVLISPSLNMSNSGFPIGDQLANIPSSGVSDTTWNPANVYVAILQNGIDNCLIIADGSTGWYRQNPHQVPGGAQGPEPIWSPFASITNGCKMVQTVETSPGIKKLLVGATTGGNEILYRDLTVFTDNGSQYNAYFVMGAIMLVHPGQLAVLKFLEMDFSGMSYTPIISYLLDEISGAFTQFTANPVFDPPSLYGTTITPESYSPNRYYFSSTGSLARCRHMQVKVDFGTTLNGDEIYNLTVFGRLFVES